ncbi:hypothetical protein DO97_15680 [Neosynechococcus sphagnicola sy1]|uniref:Glycosyltransferase n=1 Tax=Neosynechococcus sphagnicola sy1 TaxID=1497020 RepID=A0A098TIB8_9CYAN|nr:glycosyltransferase [Neosynechococcus sphagnicola]KGF71776.1 hypothetical protein DO97_15680 [Neosynechococcus sphagnicola sy1]
MHNQARIFIGYDPRERVATNVLIDSIYQASSIPVSITPIILNQLASIFSRSRDPLQSTAFSFSRFLVPYLCNYEGWAIFMDCDMLCRSDISELWSLRNDDYALMCVQHEHTPNEAVKFLGEKQTPYPKKNWSSLMLMNCQKCKSLTPEYIGTASGLDLHRFHWLESDELIGSLPMIWNHLVGVQGYSSSAKMLHYTLGGPWFPDQRLGDHSDEWYVARDNMSCLYY